MKRIQPDNPFPHKTRIIKIWRQAFLIISKAHRKSAQKEEERHRARSESRQIRIAERILVMAEYEQRVEKPQPLKRANHPKPRARTPHSSLYIHPHHNEWTQEPAGRNRARSHTFPSTPSSEGTRPAAASSAPRPVFHCRQ